jgi:hypothetical protein
MKTPVLTIGKIFIDPIWFSYKQTDFEVLAYFIGSWPLPFDRYKWLVCLNVVNMKKKTLRGKMYEYHAHIIFTFSTSSFLHTF